MKNTILFTLFLFLFIAQAKSQKFKYKKMDLVGAEGLVKLKGDVSITDTLITIKILNTTIYYPVEIIQKKDEFIQKQYKVICSDVTAEMRFTYQPNTVDDKIVKYTLTQEKIDVATKKVSIIIYFLIPDN